jgi:type I restriction enzyme S subunit
MKAWHRAVEGGSAGNGVWEAVSEEKLKEVGDGGEWRLERFVQMAILVRDTVHPSGAPQLPYIGLEHIGEGTLGLLGSGIAEDATSLKVRFRAGDVLFGKLRPYFRKVIRAPFDGICSTDIWVVRPKPGVDAGFLFYLMASSLFLEPVVRASEGTKMPRAKWEYATSLELPFPPLPEQRAIAHILGTLDDKIELNRKQNETLEAIARALFKAWFVDFEPVRAKIEGRWQRGQSVPGLPAHLYDLFPDRLVESELGEIPEGWEVQPLSELLTIIGGGTPKTSVKEYWDGDIPWFSVVDTPPASDVFVISTEKTITSQGLAGSSARLIPKGTTIISARGTVGNLAIAGREMTFNQSCYGLRGTGYAGDYFVYLTAKKMVDQLKSMAHGSVFSTITRQTFDAIQCPVPQATVLTAFEGLVAAWFEAILANVEESRSLAQLRDTLLPKLISGALRIQDAEAFLKERGL